MAKALVLDPSTKKIKLNLSPSIQHGRLADSLLQEMSYRGGDVRRWQERLRKKLIDLAGYDRMPTARQRVPLRVRSLWKRSTALGTIEKLAFTSEPGSDILAYLCLPKNAKPPYTTFICLQGHSTGAHNSIAVARENNRKPIEVAGDRDFGIGCLKRGLAALCIEQRSFGERREQTQGQIAPNGCQDATMHALLMGRTLVAERVFDVDRGIDYLYTRNDIDRRRIGVMGNSGGATISLFSAALLPRLTWAMPSCHFCTFRDSILAINHCVDNYIPRIYLFAEMSDLMGLFAPKPVVLVVGLKDEIFPIAGARKAFRELKKIYAAAGAPNNCRLVVGPEGHRFYADLAWPNMLKLMQS